MLTRRLLVVPVLLLTAQVATAQPHPQLLSIFPPGAKAGETVEVTCSGHNLDGSEKLLFSAKGFQAEPVGSATATKGPQGQPTSSVKFKVTAPKDVPGTFDVRVVTKTGLSNPRAFVVARMAEVNESEPNNDVEQAQKIELDTTVNGVISAPTDVDFVTFQAKAGQNVVVYCLTTSIDSKLQADLMVGGPDGKPLASNHNYRGGDAVLDFKAPTDGNYVVRVAQFAYTAGGYDHFYRLTATTGPWVDAVWPPLYVQPGTGFARGDNTVQPDKRFTRPDGRPYDRIAFGIGRPRIDGNGVLSARGVLPPSAAMIDAVGESLGEVPTHPRLVPQEEDSFVADNEKNNTAADAQEVKLPCDIAGRIAKKGDRHWYKFDGKKGEVWTIEVFADRIGSPVDAYFVLTDEKGKVITEQDDSPEALSPNQFYTKSDDPGRYRFSAPTDGAYKVMVSTREAGMQFGVRDQYVLRIAKEKPDFRIAVMPLSTHIPDAGTLPKGGSTAFAVFVFRFDGFNDAVELSATNLPKGVTCPKQVIGRGQTRGTLVLSAESDAEDWDGFVTIEGSAGDLKHAVRPFTVVWPAVGVQQNQIPNSPMITRMDRGGGLALAVRGKSPFTLAPTETKLSAKAGGKLEVTLKVAREGKSKDAIQVFALSPEFGPRQRGNQPLLPLATVQPDKSEVKVSVDVPNNLPPGTYAFVLRGQSAGPAPKGRNNALLSVQPIIATTPILVTVQGRTGKR